MKLNLDARFETVTTRPYTVTWQTAIGYALAIGATADDLDLLWEGHSDFRVFPTFGVVPTFSAVMKLLSGLNADLNRVVHGGQDVHIRQPIPLNVPMVSTGKITEILDKGKGAVVNIETETSTEAPSDSALSLTSRPRATADSSSSPSRAVPLPKRNTTF